MKGISSALRSAGAYAKGFLERIAHSTRPANTVLHGPRPIPVPLEPSSTNAVRGVPKAYRRKLSGLDIAYLRTRSHNGVRYSAGRSKYDSLEFRKAVQRARTGLYV